LGRRDQAIADYRKALEIDPSDEGVKKNLQDLGVTP
jgi:Flp pilus assembly protein TadD